MDTFNSDTNWSDKKNSLEPDNDMNYEVFYPFDIMIINIFMIKKLFNRHSWKKKKTIQTNDG
jgi:hypothetical protein